MPDRSHLERAREELRRASDAADRPVQTQLDSVQEGIFEEVDGERTQDEPEPKADRIAELADKLGGLAEETSGETRDRIDRARTHCLEYVDRESGE